MSGEERREEGRRARPFRPEATWHMRGQPVPMQRVEGRVEAWGGEGAREELGWVAEGWEGRARECPGGWRGLSKAFGERRACSARVSGYQALCSAAASADPGGHRR